jgi:hypothetical protein
MKLIKNASENKQHEKYVGMSARFCLLISKIVMAITKMYQIHE